MKSSTGKQIITIHTLPNPLRKKGNQTMEFGQLAECNMTISSKTMQKMSLGE